MLQVLSKNKIFKQYLLNEFAVKKLVKTLVQTI